jgi:hypothetical protein
MNGTGAGTKTQRELTLPSVDLNRLDGAACFGSLGHRCSVALALHLWTGWPIHILGNSQSPETTWSHAVVKSPKGFLDLRGLGTLERWDRVQEIRTVSDWQIFDTMGQRGEGTLESAIPLASDILAHHFPSETFKDTYTKRSFAKRFSGL